MIKLMNRDEKVLCNRLVWPIIFIGFLVQLFEAGMFNVSNANYDCHSGNSFRVKQYLDYEV